MVTTKITNKKDDREKDNTNFFENKSYLNDAGSPLDLK